MNNDLIKIIASYKAQLADCPETADRSLLHEARQLFEAQISNLPITPELAHIGHDLYVHLDDRPGIVRLMTDYLHQDLSTDQQAWARWELLDYTAALAYPSGDVNPEPCHQVVAMHREFLAWAKTHLPRDRWLWVMYDGTQAVCWRLAGYGNAWLQIFEEIYPSVEPTTENRYARFIYLRTASVAYLETGQHEQALRIAQEIYNLGFEDTQWEYCLKMIAESYSQKIYIHFKWDKLDESYALRRQFIDYLEQMESTVDEHDTPRLIQLSGAFENVGSKLFFTGDYEQSIPLIERAVMLGAGINPEVTEWTYMRLAAAVWFTTKNRRLTCDWLHRGAAICRGAGLKLSAYPALAEVADDPEFIAASTTYRSK